MLIQKKIKQIIPLRLSSGNVSLDTIGALTTKGEVFKWDMENNEWQKLPDIIVEED